MVEHPERILQSHDWDVQILRKRSSEERDETPECAERTEDARRVVGPSGALGRAGAARALPKRGERLRVFVVASARRDRMETPAGQPRAERGLSGATLAPRTKH
jgi:hypothetical protein